MPEEQGGLLPQRRPVRVTKGDTHFRVKPGQLRVAPASFGESARIVFVNETKFPVEFVFEDRNLLLVPNTPNHEDRFELDASGGANEKRSFDVDMAMAQPESKYDVRVRIGPNLETIDAVGGSRPEVEVKP